MLVAIAVSVVVDGMQRKINEYSTYFLSSHWELLTSLLFSNITLFNSMSCIFFFCECTFFFIRGWALFFFTCVALLVNTSYCASSSCRRVSFVVFAGYFIRHFVITFFFIGWQIYHSKVCWWLIKSPQQKIEHVTKFNEYGQYFVCPFYMWSMTHTQRETLCVFFFVERLCVCMYVCDRVRNSIFFPGIQISTEYTENETCWTVLMSLYARFLLWWFPFKYVIRTYIFCCASQGLLLLSVHFTMGTSIHVSTTWKSNMKMLFCFQWIETSVQCSVIVPSIGRIQRCIVVIHAIDVPVCMYIQESACVFVTPFKNISQIKLLAIFFYHQMILFFYSAFLFGPNGTTTTRITHMDCNQKQSKNK